MSNRQNCIYCDKEITVRSSEHVIHNALGGLLESEDICCPECNNFISKYIDAPFTKIFNPIIGRIDNFSKTNKTKSMPPYTGTIMYNGREYSANIKGPRVVSCPELSRELHRDISKLPLQIISYDFNLTNSAFQTGIAKIAFNYAMANSVDFKYLADGLNVVKSGNNVNSIEYKYNIIPFCPMNPVDAIIETDNKLDEPFHNMILFSQNNELWCYVNLFNTFQYYVLLSEKIPNKEQIYANYTQTLQKLNRTMPDFGDLSSPSDIMIVAQQYGVKPCMNKQEFLKRINNAVATKSQVTDMGTIIAPKIGRIQPKNLLEYSYRDPCCLHLANRAMHLYFENDRFQEKNFRVLTPGMDNSGLVSYPHEIITVCGNEQDVIKQYATMKFNALNYYLERHGR